MGNTQRGPDCGMRNGREGKCGRMYEGTKVRGRSRRYRDPLGATPLRQVTYP
jgi:hypothetical protein